MPSVTAKPNQQVIAAMREAARSPLPRRCAEARAIGERLREALAGWPLPMLAVQTTFSLLRATAAPDAWSEALGAFHAIAAPGPVDRRGGNFPAAGGAVHQAKMAIVMRSASSPPVTITSSTPTAPNPSPDEPPWVLLADHGDLLGLPACLEHLGRGRFGVGATIQIADEDLVVAAPTAGAYSRLCHFLSWRLEDPEAWRRWTEGGRFAGSRDLEGLITIVRDTVLGRRLRDLGAEVYWRAGLRPWQLASEFPIAAVPILSHIGEAGKRAAPVLHAIRERTHVDHARVIRDAALADIAAMRTAYLGFEEQIDLGRTLLARCRYVPGGPGPDGQPVYHLPPSTAEAPDARLRELAEAGISRRYGDQPPVDAITRLKHELEVIAQKHFASYILTVYDIAKGRRTCGRGSGASSIVCYLLGITNVDPVKHRLVFERFLAPERMDPPDIDVDFPWDERDEVIADTIHRYGRTHAAMVATHQTMDRWAALRDAARAHGMPDGAITEIKRQLLTRDRFGLPCALPDPWPEIIATATAIAGEPRHLGLHCGGLVVTTPPIRDLATVHPAKKEIDGVSVPALGWEKDGAEDLGFIKIDLLSNRSLAVVRDVLADLAADGVTIDEARWTPVEDIATCRLVAAGGTMGCFYIESPAMRQLQQRIGSGDFDRLVVHSSIIRPAANRWINEYVERYHRWKTAQEGGPPITVEEDATWYPHPALKELLSDSFGILSYQEDVMLSAQRLANFGSAEANQLRKALGRADTPERLRSLAGRFFDGCVANGVTEAVIEHVWSMISSFAGYSFCKAHSASFAMLSFQCAYLKAHHPGYFMARVIANEGGYYDACAYIEEARRLGVDIHGLSVVHSVWKTRREGGKSLRLGLHLVPGLSRKAADRLVATRDGDPATGTVGRPFRGLRDLRQRCHLAADELCRLQEAGALDELLPECNHAQRAWLATIVAREGRTFIEGAGVGAQQMLELVRTEDALDPIPPQLKDLDAYDLRQRRFERLKFLPEHHPLKLWILPHQRVRCRDITPAWKGRWVTVIAWSITRKEVAATYLAERDGKPLQEPRYETMAFVTLEDETGLLEATWFPDTFQRFGVLLERREPLRISGTVDVTHTCVSIVVGHVLRLATDDDRRAEFPR
jgi:DNA polymerase-3 subunit alpha/error-prone DNA polymerase